MRFIHKEEQDQPTDAGNSAHRKEHRRKAIILHHPAAQPHAECCGNARGNGEAGLFAAAFGFIGAVIDISNCDGADDSEVQAME